MKLYGGRILCSLALSLWLATASHSEDTWELEEVASGVYAAVQPSAERFQDSNSLVIVTERDVLVVDAQADTQSVERLHRAIGELTELPVRWLINTHWHSDHTQGNAVWRRLVGPELAILGHDSLLEDIPGRAAAFVEEQAGRLREQIPLAEAALAEGKGLSGQQLAVEQQTQQRAAIDTARATLERLDEVEFLTPTLSYRERLVLHRESGDIVLVHHRAHTRGDTVVWLPRQRVAATGDLLDELPYGGHGYPSSWLAALDSVAALDFAVVVPGHGPVQRSHERLELARELWSTLLERLGEGQRRGKSLEESAATLQLEGLRARFTSSDPVAEHAWEEFVPAAVERVWAELEGELAAEEGAAP